MYNICIAGGGAAGLAVAFDIASSQPDLKIAVIERNIEPGRKLKAAGNGRCNISNIQCPTFGETVRFFRKAGIEIKSDDRGWAYPVSESGEDVTEALCDRLEALGVEIHTECRITEIVHEDRYIIKCENGKEFTGEKLVMALGGKAAPSFGTTGDGYILSRNLGHNVTKLAPCLVPVKCRGEYTGNFRGIRAKGRVTLYRHGYFVEEETGEIQFTEEGMSGICMFNLSKYLVLNESTSFGDYMVSADLMPDYSMAEAFLVLKERKKVPGLRTENIFQSLVKAGIGKTVAAEEAEKTEYAADLTDDMIRKLVSSVKNMRFTVTGAGGWKEAQCTTGGVSWDDFNWETMESTKHEGLYFAGEIIDYSGPCGGYNLENAWVTGRKVSRAICTEYIR